MENANKAIYDLATELKNTREATLKRIGRAEATKMSDKEFAKEISRLMK